MNILNVKNSLGDEVSFSPKRGGIITSLKLKGKEILYFDEETFQDKDKNVRGGIPILFPNAESIPDEIKDFDNGKFSKLKRHGFARDEEWSGQTNKDGFIEVLSVNNRTLEVYPYNFELTIDCKIEDDRSFTITQMVKNLENDKVMPIASGLHPYFKVPNSAKKDIKFNFKGGDFIESNFEKWANGEAVHIDNPLVPIEIGIPELGKLILNISKEYEKIWIWSEQGKDFICIEPFMRDKGGIIKGPQMIEPREAFFTKLNINVV